MFTSIRTADISKLPKLGIPVDGEVLKRLKTERGGVSLFPSPIETAMYELDSNTVGITVGLAILNETKRRLIRLDLQRFQIQHPWCTTFHWLEDPRRYARKSQKYDFPCSQLLEFPRDRVLNHRLNGRTALLPGEPVEGILMGIGEEAAFDELPDPHEVLSTLSLYYGRGLRADLRVCFTVQRLPVAKTDLNDVAQTQRPAEPARGSHVSTAATETARHSSRDAEEVGVSVAGSNNGAC